MRVLLVDHDSESLEAITRAIRGVLELDCVTSKGDALLLLRQNQYDVLIACERAVDGSGLDLLGRTTRTAQPLKRIFAAAPERLQLLGPRLAPFKVQRTIAYPIDLEELWLAIAQVTGGPNDETDGTIERVVLDERGMASEGTVPRSPIPPRPPAPLGATPPPPPPPQPAQVASTGASGRYATARMTQPAPEPPLRAPPPPRQPPPQVRAPVPPPQPRTPAPPATTSETGRMRAIAPPPATSETGRMRALAPPIKPIAPMPLEAPQADSNLPSWTPEPLGMSNDEFAQISAQAKLGVQQKSVDDAARRKKMRLAVAAGVAIVVAGGIVFLIEKFYDPEARARDAAIAATVQQMAEQQKVTDNLTLIEIDIENAIMNNELDIARRELAKLVELKPDHPRREFLQNAIDRSAAIARLSPQNDSPPATPQQAAVVQSPSSASRSAAQRARSPERTPERVVARAPDRTAPSRSQRDEAPPSSSSQRSYGAPIGEAPRPATIPLDAPINTPPSTTSTRRADNSFVGRTLEASDSATMSRAPTPAPQPPAQAQAVPTSTVGSGAAPSNAGSAVGPMPAAAPAAAPTQAGATAEVDVVPAKIVRRVTPVAPFNIPKKTSGYVVLMFSINEKGRVSDVSVVESTPPGVFDDAAMTAVRKWVYDPRRENGIAVPSQSKARLVFAAAE